MALWLKCSVCHDTGLVGKYPAQQECPNCTPSLTPYCTHCGAGRTQSHHTQGCPKAYARPKTHLSSVNPQHITRMSTHVTMPATVGINLEPDEKKLDEAEALLTRLLGDERGLTAEQVEKRQDLLALLLGQRLELKKLEERQLRRRNAYTPLTPEQIAYWKKEAEIELD